MRKHTFSIIMVLALFAGIAACKKDNDSKPVITQLRAISPAPNDSTLTLAGPGQTVVIQGSGFASTLQIYFNGYPAPFNSALLSDNNIVVTIPADMPFASLDPSQLNTVKVVTRNGEVVFNFPIVPPPPVITGMSNENAVAGTRVTIYGNNFFFIDKVVFPGGIEVAANLEANTTGTTLAVTVPAGITTGGSISVVNSYGTGTSVLLFNDFETGVLTNSDNISQLEWGSDVIDDPSRYPGGHGKYNLIKASNVGGGDLGWWNGTRSINTFSGQWVPPADLDAALGDYALKFELNVKVPWSVGRLYVVRNYDWTYLANYTPWKKADGSSETFVTDGWQTVVIPLTEFRTKNGDLDGTGSSAPSLKTLVGNDGTGTIHFMLVNPETTEITEFEAAIDNIRIVKIK